jgi:hypothetical protein
MNEHYSLTPLLHFLTLGLLLCACAARAAEDEGRRSYQADMPGGAFKVVAAEGALEPRSIGSYDLRIYAQTNPHFPYDNFVAGTIRPRDGMLASLLLSNLDYLGMDEILVVVRSVGSGGYQTVDGFRLAGAELIHLGTLEALPKDADPVGAFRAALLNQGVSDNP